MNTSFSHMVDNFDKVTIVTGGSKGIGEGCARVFVRAGAKVVVCARGSEAGEALAAELAATGPGTCHFIQCDVTQPEQISRVVEDTVKLHGRLDVLINNAGWHPPHKTIDDFSIDEFKQLLQLNLVSYFAACKAALPHLRRTQGAIINMSSLVGSIGQEWATTYAATKGGIIGLTKALAVDDARNGVRVNVVLPGAIATPLVESFMEAPAQRDFIESWGWNGRVGTIEEVGEACLFLASESASFITGVELVISGGAELAYGTKYTKGGQVRL
ncbi:MAG: glucose 1-dehydrogenase [Anaerolineales bacterium]|nr:glucose 1-dehydrogenase [Anaerolineales bacterium]